MAIKKEQLEEHFKVTDFKLDGKLLLFSKTVPSTTMNGTRYEAYIYPLKYGKYKVEGGIERNKIEDLLMDIKDWQSQTFKYNQDYYCPMYKPHMLTYYVLWARLRELGIKDGLLFEKDPYGFKSIDMYFEYTPDHQIKSEEDDIKFSLSTSNSSRWFTVSCSQNPDEVIETIDSMLLPYYLSSAAMFIQKADLMTSNINLDNVDEVKVNVRTLEVEVNKAKQTIIKSLQDSLDKLNTTRIITVNDVEVTECCKIPDTNNQKYCSECGKKIIRS